MHILRENLYKNHLLLSCLKLPATDKGNYVYNIRKFFPCCPLAEIKNYKHVPSIIDEVFDFRINDEFIKSNASENERLPNVSPKTIKNEVFTKP